jgi:hypothetical protein
MANRREFLQLGLAAAAWPVASGAVPDKAGVMFADVETVPLYKVIYDTRYEESVVFGERVRRMGLPVRAIRGDVTDLWFNDLSLRWRERPVAIGGLTGTDALFCLEQLAWDHRMRVVLRAEHRYREDGSIEHAISGPEILVRHGPELYAAAGPEWVLPAARCVTQCPVERRAKQRVDVAGAKYDSRWHASEPLVSWVIAPRAA